MKLELIINTRNNQTLLTKLDPMGSIYEAFDFWSHQPKLQSIFSFRGEEKSIEYVLAPPSFLNYIAEKEEPFGVHVGDMIFINSHTHQKRPEWTKYIALRLFSSNKIISKSDNPQLNNHWESLYRTTRLMANQMKESDLFEFLDLLNQYDTSEYFDLDVEAKRFLESSESLIEAKRKYLEKHHENIWVKRGRDEEFLQSLGFNNRGFKNHAEAILSSSFDSTIDQQYLYGDFIRKLAFVDIGVPLEISPPFNQFAYTLTKNCNGVSDMIDFITPEALLSTSTDVIIKRKERRRTWNALLKRISYQIHTVEKNLRNITEKKTKGFHLIQTSVNGGDQDLSSEIDDISLLLQKGI